ncbi:MAG: 5' nucleotidase, NT5C type [Acidimicrobiia bacterium]
MTSPADGFILGVDLDGVCGDYTAALRAVVAGQRGIDPASLPVERSWDFREWGLSPVEFQRIHREAVLEHRIFRTMPAFPGAAEVLWRLSDAGVWIRIITHRLYVNWGHATAVADTVDWLDSVGIPYRDLCFLGAKPQVEADCYVEDAPHNVVALRSTGSYVIVFDQPYNREVDGPRAGDWAGVEEQVAERIAALGLSLQAPLPGFEDVPHRLRRRVRPSDASSPP